MSGFTQLNEPKMWQTVESYLAYIPLEANRETVRRYVEERFANGMKPATIGIDVNALRSLGVFLGDKPFVEATKPDMIRYFNTVTGTRSWKNAKKSGEVTTTTKEVRLSYSTREKRKEVFKPFYRWLLGLDEDDPIPCLKGIKSRKKGSSENVPVDELLTPDDLKALLLHAKHDQARAVIAVLYESGLRAGEFCALNIGSVMFDEFGAVLTLPKDGVGLKTGSRRVRLFDSVSYLHTWYEQHPLKDGRSFLLLGSRSRGHEATSEQRDLFPHPVRVKRKYASSRENYVRT